MKIDKITIWLNQQKIAYLFDVQKAAISRYTKNIFGMGDLFRDRVVSKMEIIVADWKKHKVDCYNLDLTLSVGYRVNIHHHEE